MNVQLAAPVTALFGPSGVGKTSLLETVAGLRRPVEGEIRIDDFVLYSSRQGVCLPPEKRRVGYVPQGGILFPHLSVAGNIRYGIRSAGAHSANSIPMEAAVEALEIGHLLERKPRGLSGGESQRVALARALVTQPRLLLLDEPLAALDVGLKERILPYLKRVRELYGIPALVVSHDVFEVMTLCDEVVVLQRGAVVETGPPGRVMTSGGAGGAFFRGPFENILDTRTVEHEPDEGLTRVETARATSLFIPHHRSSPGDRVILGVLAEDILVARQAPEGLSARNVVPGTVGTIEEQQAVAMIRVDTPDPFYVRLTHRAVTHLGLEVGSDVHLIIKTHSIHPLSPAQTEDSPGRGTYNEVKEQRHEPL